MKLIKTSFFLLVFLASLCGEAQELPPIQNFSSNQYGAENQNWSISQSDEKYIYVANNSGLLEYNGAKWELYTSPNNSIIRSVNCVKNIIYTGAYMEFGYWEKNKFGGLDYTSLSKNLDEPLLEEDFWNILSIENAILFQSLHRIYIYNTQDESFKIINSETQLPKVFLVDGSVYFQIIDKGLFKIEKGNPVLLSDNFIFKTNLLANIVKIGHKIFFQTQLKGFYYLEEKQVKKWDISANNVLSKLSLYSSLQLRDGSLILGTISNGIYHLDKNGDIVGHINQENGLNNNTVLSIYEDRDKNIWLGLDNGISVVNFDSALVFYNDGYGRLGSVYATIVFKDNLYLGTNQGLFYKKLGSNGDFSFVEGTSGQVWCFRIYDDTLFCGHNEGTFVVDKNKATLVSDAMGVMEIKSAPNNKNLLIQGCYSGLTVLEKINNTWKLRNKINGFDPASRFFEFTKNGNILVNHEYRGVFKLEVNKDFTSVLKYKLLEKPPKALKSGITNYNGEVFYASDLGIFKFNNYTEKFEKDSLLSSDFLSNDSYVSGRFIEDVKTNTLWGFTEKSLIYFSQGKLNRKLKSTKIFIGTSLRHDIPGFESMVHLKDQEYLFGSSEAYFILDLNKIKVDDFEIEINSIEKSNIEGITQPVVLNGSGVNFKNDQNNISFKYNVTDFNKYEEVNFQYQLEGMYNQWSQWSRKSEIAFKNLPFGSYTFKVKARIGNKVSTNVAMFTFVIEKPWYISNLMIALYFFIFLILIVFVNYMYKRNFDKQKELLLLKKQRELAFNLLESEKVIMKLKNEKLQQEIDSKTRELASSTMNIIKKNEILNTIKSELVDVKDTNGVKPVLKIINKNLSNSGDWEMFQEAFNSSDNNFLKKLKSLHPKLTPNDLRLCAYLRLNLSSKEIAPLLNISVRSVEIKRYRLRKKMELAHAKGLVEYILEL